MRIRSKSTLAGMLAASTLLLAACGGSGAGLIPEGNAIPLRSDFQAVSEAAQEANGECAATERAIRRMEQDFRALPASVDHGLHAKLEEGVGNLRSRALVSCERRSSTTTSSTTTTETSTTTTATTSTTPTTTTTETSTTTSTEPTTSATSTYSETSTTPVTPSETGGTEASGSSGSPGGALPEAQEEPAAPAGAAAGGVP